MKVLILSAPVGGGHDAAARGVAAELRRRGATVDVDDGLALIGWWMHRLAVNGYRRQIAHASWSWRALYRATSSRLVIRIACAVLALMGGRRLRQRIESGGYDHVVSVYPVVSMVLARLRLTGRLRVPCSALITDFDPHPAWVHPDLDVNLGIGGEGRGAVLPVRPPVRLRVGNRALRARLRADLGLQPEERAVLIAGGAWGVGNLHGAAKAVAAVPRMRPVVVTGHNEQLRRRLEADASLHGAILFGFTQLMPDLMGACDALVINAGGLTCLEAFGAGLPVVMFDPLPGHGEDNGRHMTRVGLVTAAGSETDLRAVLADPCFWTVSALRTAAAGRALFNRPCTADYLASLRPAVRRTRRATPARRAAAVAAAVVALGMSDRITDAVAVAPVHHHRTEVREWPGR